MMIPLMHEAGLYSSVWVLTPLLSFSTNSVSASLRRLITCLATPRDGPSTSTYSLAYTRYSVAVDDINDDADFPIVVAVVDVRHSARFHEFLEALTNVDVILTIQSFYQI